MGDATSLDVFWICYEWRSLASQKSIWGTIRFFGVEPPRLGTSARWESPSTDDYLAVRLREECRSFTKFIEASKTTPAAIGISYL
jgi:hypothetical protein